MRRDILVLWSATLAIGLISWALLGNPPMVAEPPLPIAQSLKQDPDLKLVSKHSPYMRTER